MLKGHIENPRTPNLRLKTWNYTSDGWYFVTIITKHRKAFFGYVQNGVMHLSDVGQLAHNNWLQIPDYFPTVTLDEFVVMPDHIHGILIIRKDVHPTDGKDRSRPVHAISDCVLYKDLKLNTKYRKNKSLSDIVGAFKTITSKTLHKNGFESFSWHRSFYDHIIRNEKPLLHIREYIKNNPKNYEKSLTQNKSKLS